MTSSRAIRVLAFDLVPADLDAFNFALLHLIHKLGECRLGFDAGFSGLNDYPDQDCDADQYDPQNRRLYV